MLGLNHQTGSLQSSLLLAMDRKLYLGFPVTEASLQLPANFSDLMKVGSDPQPQLQSVHLLPDTDLGT